MAPRKRRADHENVDNLVPDGYLRWSETVGDLTTLPQRATAMASSRIPEDEIVLSMVPSESAQARRSSRDQRDDSTTARHATTHQAPAARAPPAPTSKQGRLGQYNIVKTLGEGSFGKVKLAIHQVSGQKVALKIIARRKLVTRDMAGRIEREIQYLQLLRHPHIIKLFTVITTPTEIIMVLEYAGGELFDYIVQNGKMAEDKARKFFQQIICAVEYCHRHKIVHRDLKPENLLLDEQLNVKIADFGLSNIMTDGNFLKTSCGSPNYAAPEVISGKLYAGPEVDVWSCGVILYVLLVGRLPFDDEYIPALFKKIGQGNYMVPNYLSSGAVRLIGKMLQVNPVNRITVPDIRQDPWFTKDLADYLLPTPEDFVDTGIDPSKAIDPQTLSKGKPQAMKDKLHQSVVGKLGKTMGYAPNDVQDALSKDEPSAIKDAYLIVRENQLMKTNPSLAQDQPQFMAQSPPAFHSSSSAMPGTPRSPFTKQQPASQMSNIDHATHPRHSSTSSAQISFEVRAPVSTIGILPSSLPDYHTAYMRGHIDKSHSPPDTDTDTAAASTDEGHPRSKEEQEATARRLKPHNKSQANLNRHAANVAATADKPEPMTSIPEKPTSSTNSKETKKLKPTKWQFGIRSRNTPTEAMLAIYKALAKMGAQWEEPVLREPGGGSADGEEGGDGDGEGRESPEYSDSDPDAGTDPEYASREEQEQRRRRRQQQQQQRAHGNDGPRGRERYGRWNDYGYELPEDPWVINARFKKEGMYPPGVTHPSSTHSSRVDLNSLDSKGRRRSSTQSSSLENLAAIGPSGGSVDGASVTGLVGSETVWVYVTIQLYSIETDFYLVDFKCAGYERLVRKFAKTLASGDLKLTRSNAGADGDDWDDAHESSRGFYKGDKKSREEDTGAGDGNETEGEDGETLVGVGRTEGEKEISSPFPFLDVSSRLIIQLAEAGE